MPICVKDIQKLDSLKKLELIAGKNGLDKPIEWIYVAECFDDPLESIKWIQGGELAFITGLGIKDNENILVDLIKGISEKEGVGLIVNIGKYIKSIPTKAIEVANELDFPIFILPWEVHLVDVSKEISNSIITSRIEENTLNQFLNNILFGDGLLENNPVEKAAYFGYELEGKCYVSILRVSRVNPKEDIKSYKHSVFRIKKNLCEMMNKNGLNIPVVDNDGDIIVINKYEENAVRKLENSFSELEMSTNHDDYVMKVGVGNEYDDLRKIKHSYLEAELAVKSLGSQKDGELIKKYKNIGLYALLYGITNRDILINYYTNQLGDIIEKNKKSNDVSELKILETYLNENCSITETAEKLFMHRNTLKYKINKIEKTLNCDFHNFDDCVRLKIAIFAKNVIEN